MTRNKHVARRLGLLALAAAISAITSLEATAPAYAHVSKSCNQYSFPEAFVFQQGNYKISFSGSGGPNISTNAWAADNNFGGNDGVVNGSVKGRQVDFTIHWRGGAIGSYSGIVGDRDLARGTTKDLTRPGSTSIWTSLKPLTCVASALGPAKKLGKSPRPGKQLGKALISATVEGDVDVYDRPNENANNQARKLGILRTGARVALMRECEPSAWCEVSGNVVPGGRGWVWGHLRFS